MAIEYAIHKGTVLIDEEDLEKVSKRKWYRYNGGRFAEESLAAQAAYELRIRLQGDICR